MEPHVRLLGRPCIEVGGVISEPEASRGSAMLYYLASKGAWVSRDELTFLFWPDADQSRSQGNLRQLIYCLREFPYAADLDVERARLRWRVTTDTSQGSPAALSLHLSSSTAQLGPQTFMAGFALKNAPEFDQWLEDQRTYWGQRMRAELMKRMEDLLSVSDVSITFTTLKAGLEHDPLDEDLVYGALELCWRYGWVDAGERLYRAYESELRREVGLSPSERIQSARASLLAIIHPVQGHTHEPAATAQRYTVRHTIGRPRRIEYCRPIPAGKHYTTHLPVPLSFSAPEGWEVWKDTPRHFAIGRAVDEFRERYYLTSSIRVRYNVHALVQTCEEGVMPEVPIDSESLSSHWRSLPSVDSSWPIAVSVGGLAGVSFDLSMNPSTTQVCSWSQGRPIALLMGQPGPNGLQHGIHAGERLRLTILDHPDGNVIIEVIHTPHTPMTWTEWMEVTGSIIGTFEFDVPARWIRDH